MKINWRDKEGELQSLDIITGDESVREMEVMGTHTLTLYFALPMFVEVPIGAYCTFEGRKYELLTPQRFAKYGNRKWEYTLTMSAPDGLLALWKVRNPADGSLEFPYTATPTQHIELLVTILNSHKKEGSATWRVGKCVDAPEKLINYNHTQLSDALSELATLFETEYEITTENDGGVDYNILHLCKVEYFKDSPIALSYGREGGFLPNLRRENSDKLAVERLFVQGTEENISSAHYKPLGGEVGSRRLLLPLAQEFGFDGEFFSDDTNYDSVRGKLFRSSGDGQSITFSDKEDTVGNEDSLDCTDIIPAKEIVVVDVEVEKAINGDGKEYNEYNLILAISQSEDYRNYQVDGEVAYIVFQSGKLSGREFDIHTRTDDALDIEQVYDNTGAFIGWRFKLVAEEQDGYLMPSDVWEPAIGDKVKVFGVQLPESAICDNENRSGASWDMMREAIRVMWERNMGDTYYEGEISTSWVARNWQAIGAKVRIGGYVRFTDPAFEKEGALIRITSVKTYINNSHAPQITLSNEVVRSSVKTTIEQIKGEEVTVDNVQKKAKDYTKRRFRDAKESQALLEKALSGEFSETLSPIAVNTMQAIVGSTTLQYTFVASLSDMTPQSYTPKIANETIELPSAYIKHETLGIEEVKPERDYTEYLRWEITGDTLAFEDGDIAYYLYIRASQTSQDANFVLSAEAIALDAEGGYYHFLLATIGKLIEGVRSYQAWNGFTEITPAAIRANRFVSTDGLQFIDFEKKEFRVGDSDKFVRYENGELEVAGAILGESVLGNEIKALDVNGNTSAAISGKENEPLIYGALQIKAWYQWYRNNARYIYTLIPPDLMSEGDVIDVYYSVGEPAPNTTATFADGALLIGSYRYLTNNVVEYSGNTVSTARYKLMPSGAQIIGNPNGSRIEIQPTADSATIVVYDEENKPRTTVSDAQYDNIESLVPSTTEFSISGIISPNIRFGEYRDDTIEVSFVAKQSGTLEIPQLVVRHQFNGTGWGAYDEDLSVETVLTCYLDGTPIRFIGKDYNDDINAYGVNSVNNTIPHTKQTTPYTLPVSVGSHKLKFRLHRNFIFAPASAQGNIVSNCIFSVLTSVKVTYQNYKAVLFSNGLAVANSSDDIFAVLHTENGLIMRAQNTDYGMEINNSGMQVRIGGVWYKLGIADGKVTASKIN